MKCVAVGLVLSACGAPSNFRESYTCPCLLPDGGATAGEFRFIYCPASDTETAQQCRNQSANYSRMCCNAFPWAGCGATSDCTCVVDYSFTCD